MTEYTFHKHEVHSVIIYKNCIERWGLIPSKITQKLIRAHQVRFYLNTRDRTYRSFLIELGQGQLRRFFNVLRADRLGNKANIGKPLMTHEMRELQWKLEDLDRYTFYTEELDLPVGLDISWARRRELAALCQQDRRRNQQVYLIDKLIEWSNL